jgi:hypothetical protein
VFFYMIHVGRVVDLWDANEQHSRLTCGAHLDPGREAFTPRSVHGPVAFAFRREDRLHERQADGADEQTVAPHDQAGRCRESLAAFGA